MYGVLLIGPESLDDERSAALQQEALLARAAMAAGGDMAAFAGVESDEAITKVRLRGDQALFADLAVAADAADAELALDFGADADDGDWLAVAIDADYAAEVGYGWLPVADDSEPTPEELYYAHSAKYGGPFLRDRVQNSVPFWPYKEPMPVPFRTGLSSGTPHRFQIDAPDGDYTLRITTTNVSWTNRNFLLSGMVSVNGAVRLLDAVHDRGALVTRECQASAEGGKLELEFGGPTGWAVAALQLRPAIETVNTMAALRSWRVSPRYQNPEWYPISWVSTPVEDDLAPTDDWTTIEAADEGWPIVDLGSNREAESGDIVYAATTISSALGGRWVLRFGSSSSAQIWLNGELLAYVPNEKGVRENELELPIDLEIGDNTLIVKLQRFWERHWMFYAGVGIAVIPV